MSRIIQSRSPALPLRAGALPFRSNPGKGTEILLVRRREHVFWAPPKGHAMAGRELHEAASIEAFEEAGAKGTAHPVPLGSYLHTKSSPTLAFISEKVEVVLFQLRVEALTVSGRKWNGASDGGFAGTRRRRWSPPVSYANS